MRKHILLMSCQTCKSSPAQLWRCSVTLDAYCGNECRNAHWSFISGKRKQDENDDDVPGERDKRLTEVLRIVGNNPAALSVLARNLDTLDVLHWSLVSHEFSRMFVHNQLFWYIVLQQNAPGHKLARKPFEYGAYDYRAAAFKHVPRIRAHVEEIVQEMALGQLLRDVDGDRDIRMHIYSYLTDEDRDILFTAINSTVPLPRFTTQFASAAAGNGYLALLQWARAHDCPWDEWICALAAKGGHLTVLKWARQQKCPWSEITCAQAAGGGHLAVLKWARKNRCPWDSWTCSAAARGGHLAVLQWARRHRCPWDALTCLGAAHGGHLDVLQWAVEHGCPWNAAECEREALDNGHDNVVQWIRGERERRE